MLVVLARVRSLSVKCRRWPLIAVIAACSSDPAVAPPPTSMRDAIVPIGWYAYPSAAFTVGEDHSQTHSGSAAAYISGAAASLTNTVGMYQDFLATPYRGKRMRLSAWVKHSGLANAGTGLYMEVEGPGAYVAKDDMSNRPLAGTADWHQVSIVLDVPATAIGIELGANMAASGDLMIDDVKFEAVGQDVPSTNTLTTPILTGDDPAAVAAAYALGGDAPRNLNFEGAGPTSQTAVDWLGRNAVALTSTDPQAPLDDLIPLERMVGSAQIIGLGEGTHGTREFFQMKHRILEALVRDMGVTVFAMEATTPESNDLNQYVLNGVGDPKILLSRLYFWTWNTQEVLDLIQWMRAWNLAAPPSRQVQFAGFDLQSPGESMDSVQAFAATLNPPDSAYVAQRFSCINPYRNRNEQPQNTPWSFYAGKTSDADKALCRAGLQDVYDLIASYSSRFPAAASAKTFDLRLHDAHLIQEFERMIAVQNVTSFDARDQYMAENVGWIRDHLASGGRVVLWAHNGHINAIPQNMGGYLRATYGSDYVAVGMVFGTGEFNSVGRNGEGLRAWRATYIPPSSIEAVFAGTNKPLLLLDARQIAAGGAAAAPLAGPIDVRSIGAQFDSKAEPAYFGPRSFPLTFDLLVYVQTTNASTLLPFVFR